MYSDIASKVERTERQTILEEGTEIDRADLDSCAKPEARQT
jgi:hypothetical protein